MDFSQRLAADEALESLDAEGELGKGEGSLPAETAVSQTDQVLLIRVFWSVDDAEVFASPAFEGWLGEPAAALVNESERLDDHALAASTRELFPPGDSRGLGRGIGEIDDEERSWKQELGVGLGEPGKRLDVPEVILVDMDAALGGQEMKRGQLQIRQRFDTPAIAAIGVDEPADVLLAATRRTVRSRMPCPSRTPPNARRHRRAPRWPSGRAARPEAPTGAYCARSSSCALADQGMSSQSRHAQCVSSSDQSPDAIHRRADAIQKRSLERLIAEESPAGAGGDHADLAGVDAEALPR